MKMASSLLSSLLLLAAMMPAALAQAPLNNPPAAQQQHPEIDPLFLIKSKPAYELLKKPNPPLVIDVRSRAEFNAEHIQGAISYPWSTIKVGGEYPFSKDRQLLLYCGCPHHLSGMSAEVLRQKGYTKVNVIDEGYWGWKAFGFPVYVNPNAPKQTSMSFDGQLVAGLQGAAYRDVFLLHPETGQLEAVRTDANGNFTMHLHFGGVSPQDTVLFQVADQTIKETTLAELNQKVHLELPEQLALAH